MQISTGQDSLAEFGKCANSQDPSRNSRSFPICSLQSEAWGVAPTSLLGQDQGQYLRGREVDGKNLAFWVGSTGSVAGWLCALKPSEPHLILSTQTGGTSFILSFCQMEALSSRRRR